MPVAHDSPEAVVLLPPVRGRLTDRGLLRWLSRCRIRDVPVPLDSLAQTLHALGREPPDKGLAALRMWGQTGERPAAWIAAADPVYMEPRLDRLFLHALGGDEVSSSELRRLFDALQATLGSDGALGFAPLGSCGYIHSEQPLVTPADPAAVLDGKNPDGSLPAAAEAADTLKLISEIEMTLHEQPVNEQRRSRGQPPVNSLWLWGGGYAPDQGAVPMPPLYGGGPLLRGYWQSVSAPAVDWPGTIEACLEEAPAGFVAAVPRDREAVAAADIDLAPLRNALRSGRLRRVVLISADGVHATLRGSDRFRVWRRKSPLLGPPSA